ncbi:hypothetical protein GGF49_003636 [Coemansia sp. RSA 1853]|nr:hypothetical protein GGF49_003636 [Coemansia sp. RSA 1853]
MELLGWRIRWGKRATRRTRLAQYLPSHIIQRIVHHITLGRDKSTHSLDHLSRAAHPLVGVCRNWRASILSVFYAHYNVDINCSSMHMSLRRRMVPTTPSINDCVRALARSVRITAPFAGVFGGKVTRIMDSSGFVGAVFMGVDHVWLNFYAGLSEPVDEMGDVQGEIAKFVARIWAMFPRAQHLHMQVSLFTDSDDSQMVGALLGALATRRLQTVEYVHVSSGVRMGGLAGVTGLTHIRVQDDASLADCVSLVRSNAQTLVEADLGVVDALDCLPRLTVDDNGEPITYPRLRSLAIHVNLLPEVTVASFPALETLRRTTGHLHVANEIETFCADLA